MAENEEIQEAPQVKTINKLPRKQGSTMTKLKNLFKYFSLFSEWFANFGELHAKHFPSDENNT